MLAHLSPARERWLFHLGWMATAGAAALLPLGLWIERGSEGLVELGGLATLSMFGVGKFIVFAGLRDATPLGPWGLAAMVWLVDVLWAFAILGCLSRLPTGGLFGRALARAQGRARDVLDDYPRLESMAFFGVALLVFLPIAATGAWTGAFAAELVGLRRLPGVLAVALGAGLTAALFAVLATFLGENAEELLHNRPLQFGLIVSAGAAGWLAFRYVKRTLRGEGAPPGGDEPRTSRQE